MIYEFRKYDLKPRTLGQYDSTVEKALAGGRPNYSPLFGYWYSEFGQLNQALHIWPYRDLQERTEVREQVAAALPEMRGLGVVRISERTGKGLAAMMKAAFAARDVWARRVATAPLNQWLAAATASLARWGCALRKSGRCCRRITRSPEASQIACSAGGKATSCSAKPARTPCSATAPRVNVKAAPVLHTETTWKATPART